MFWYDYSNLTYEIIEGLREPVWRWKEATDEDAGSVAQLAE